MYGWSSAYFDGGRSEDDNRYSLCMIKAFGPRKASLVCSSVILWRVARRVMLQGFNLISR